MNYPSNSPIIGTSRNGLQDMWNAFMVRGAKFSVNDIPLCPTTATSLPAKLISYDEAKCIHKKEMRRGNGDYHVDAFIHFYIDDQKFDGKRTSIWLYYDNALEIIRHFSGIITPDFSTYADFPEPIKLWNFYRMNAFGYWIGSQKIPKAEIPQYIMTAVKFGTIVDYQGRGLGRPIYEFTYEGTTRRIAITIGSNGYVVRSVPTQSLSLRRLNNEHLKILP